MTFDRPWVLLFTLAPVVWAMLEWRGAARRTALLLKAGAFFAIMAALAEPRLSFSDSKIAVAILADTSRSLTSQDLERASSIATEIDRARGRHWTQVIPFARSARKPLPRERSKSWNFDYTEGEAGHATDLEAAIREAIGTLPGGMIRRVALISDGNENLGSVTRAAWQAQHLGIPIDTFPLAGSPSPDLRVESVALPSLVFSGEHFPIDLTVASPRRASARVEVTADGKRLGLSDVNLDAGLNHLRVRASVATTGAVDLAGTITGLGLGQARFDQAVTIRRPRALLITSDPAGTEEHLRKTLESSQFELQVATAVPESFSDYQLVVFNNWDAESLPTARKQALEKFVQQGGGLLWIAGERNIYVENKRPDDALDRTLPAKLAPPRTPEGTCVVLIIDKSSSMEGKKMELARLAAIGVVENLRPIDQVGVLIFDNSFQWAVPVRRAEDRSLIKRLIAGITPDGGTQIAPALTEAYRKILYQNAVYKHVVLLTDGISEEGDSLSLAREASNNRITISTVGLGQDVNRAYLEKIATLAKGKAYFLNEPAGLEQILLKDVQEHTGSTAVEKPSQVSVTKPAELLDGVGIESAPPLRGYIRYITKPTADTILSIDEHDPLLVRWQYGLGRATVFTSDAKSRWAAGWLTWNGFDRLWANIARDLLPRAQSSEAQVEFDSSKEQLVVNYHLGQKGDEPAAVPAIYALGPNGFRAPLDVTKTAAASYRGTVQIGRNQGLFRVRPLVESRSFPEIGFYRPEDELTDHACDEQLLRQIAKSTGGRYNPPISQIFDAGGRGVPSTMELWPGLLALALLLNLAELVSRKWRGLVESIRPPAASPARS